jgi:hypothetical protein
MITRDPLRVSYLDDKYWASYEKTRRCEDREKVQNVGLVQCVDKAPTQKLAA